MIRSRLACAAAVLVSLSLSARATAETLPSAVAFAITGTVVSTRDGSPVPFAVLHAVPTPEGIRVAQRGEPQADRFGGLVRDGAGRGGGGRRPPRFAASPADEITVNADGSGHFHMALPHAGSWTLTGRARGFNTRTFDEHQGYFASVFLSEIVTTYNLTFHLIPEALLAGTVVDEAGEPIERAQVTAERLPQGSGDASDGMPVRQAGFTTTDDRGHFEIDRLNPGSYRVKVVAQPWYAQGTRSDGLGPNGQIPQPSAVAAQDPSLDVVYAPTWYPGTADVAAAEPLVLAAGEEREADVHLTAAPAVHLEISLPPAQADGGSRRNNALMLTRVAATGFDFATSIATVGSVGRSGSLSPGIYQVRRNGFEDDSEVTEIEIPVGASGAISLENARPLIKVALAFDGAGSDASNQQVTLVDTVSGRRITANQPFQRRFRRDDAATAQTAPPERSIYAPPGRYAVYLTAPQAYMTGLSAEGARIDGRFVTIADGKPRLTVHLATGRAELGGVVQAAGSGAQPVEGAMVVLVPITLGQAGDLAEPYRDESNTDGSFELIGIVPGKYILIALDHGWDVDFHDPAALAKYLVHGVPLEVAAGNHVERQIDAQVP